MGLFIKCKSKENYTKAEKVKTIFIYNIQMHQEQQKKRDKLFSFSFSFLEKCDFEPVGSFTSVSCWLL